MANGHSAALLPLAPEGLEDNSAGPPNGATIITLKPAATPATAMELEIGGATAAAVVAIAMGVDDYAEGGGLSPTSKVWCGAMLGRLAQLQLDTLGDYPKAAFYRVMRREGRRALQTHPGVVFLTRLGPSGQVDAAFDTLFDSVTAIVERVVASELALRMN